MQVAMVRNVDSTASLVRYMVTPSHENRVGCVQSNPELSRPSRNDWDSKLMAAYTCLPSVGSPRAATRPTFPGLGGRVIHFEHRQLLLGGGPTPGEGIESGAQDHVLGE